MKREHQEPDRLATEGAPCAHDYRFDRDLEDWVCEKCGRSLELVTQFTHHECGPDCDEHGDIAAIG